MNKTMINHVNGIDLSSNSINNGQCIKHINFQIV